MTIEQVYQQLAEIYPGESVKISIDRTWDSANKFRSSYYIFVPNAVGSQKRIWSSDRSWEHALAQARSSNEDIWEEQQEPMEAANA